jgi:hypothetical protein
MGAAMDKYRVTLDAEERVALEQLVNVGKRAARKLIHARVLLLADTSQGEARPDTDIVRSLGISLRTVERVRRRLVTEGLPAALDHRPQPARPGNVRIKGDVERKLIQLACSDPPRGAASGRCNCWPTNWSCWAWSTKSAPRPCGRR